ncbi:MAG: hypothetical protein ACM3VS_07185 [Candidatus Dadabacteria bacterium]
MKQLFFTLLCMAFTSVLLAQEKYPTPTLTPDQKFNRSVNQYWAITAAAISQAKVSGISPYNYGKSIGKLFAPTWRNPDFDGFVKGMLWNFESFRLAQEKPPVAKENADGSVTLMQDDKRMHTYFTNTPFNVSYEEALDYFKGITDVFASDIIHAKGSFEHQDSILVYNFKKF